MVVLKGKMLEKAEWNFFDKVIQDRDRKKEEQREWLPNGREMGLGQEWGTGPPWQLEVQESKIGRFRIIKSMEFTCTFSSVVQCRGR